MQYDENTKKKVAIYRLDVKNASFMKFFSEKYWQFMNKMLYYNYSKGKGIIKNASGDISL